MKYLNWIFDESPWLIRAPFLAVLCIVLFVLVLIGKLVLTERQWERLDRYMSNLTTDKP